MAPARHSRHSKSAKANRLQYATRPVEKRESLPIIVVRCDDCVTAPRYFEELARACKATVRITVRAAPNDGATAFAVVEAAIKDLQSLDRQASDRQAVWALIDTEGDPSLQSKAFDAQKFGQENGVGVALSCPCYELWTLLHLEDTGQQFDNCSKVYDALKQAWQQEFGQSIDKKTQIDCGKLLPLIGTAIKNAGKHREANDPSWTEVYQVIEDIQRLGGVLPGE